MSNAHTSPALSMSSTYDRRLPACVNILVGTPVEDIVTGERGTTAGPAVVDIRRGNYVPVEWDDGRRGYADTGDLIAA